MHPSDASRAAPPRPPGGFGVLGCIAGVGSTATMLILNVTTSYAQFATGGRGWAGFWASLLSMALTIFGIWLIPLLYCQVAARRARQRYGATDRDVRQLLLVAVALYVAHLPLVWLLSLVLGLGGWPWR